MYATFQVLRFIPLNQGCQSTQLLLLHVFYRVVPLEFQECELMQCLEFLFWRLEDWLGDECEQSCREQNHLTSKEGGKNQQHWRQHLGKLLSFLTHNEPRIAGSNLEEWKQIGEFNGQEASLSLFVKRRMRKQWFLMGWNAILWQDELTKSWRTATVYLKKT